MTTATHKCVWAATRGPGAARERADVWHQQAAKKRKLHNDRAVAGQNRQQNRDPRPILALQELGGGLGHPFGLIDGFRVVLGRLISNPPGTYGGAKSNAP